MRISAPALLFLAALTGASPVRAASQTPPVYNTQPLLLCPAITLQVCGFSFTAFAGSPGTLYNFTLPNRYVVTSVPVQCVTDGTVAYYRTTDTSAMNCVLRTCKPTTVNICDNEIAIRAETAVDTTVNQILPANLLASTAAPYAPTLSARCNLVNGDARYEVDENSISCNLFACKPARLNACGSTVFVAQQADLGAALQAETENHKPVTIQCLGSEARAPHYIVFDQNCN